MIARGNAFLLEAATPDHEDCDPPAFLPTALPLAAINAPLNTTDPRANISIETLKPN